MIGGALAGVNLTLFIFAALPASGGHINPLITLGSFAIRSSSLPRTLLYIAGQTIGATGGAGLLRAAVGPGAIAAVSAPCRCCLCLCPPANNDTDRNPRLHMERRRRREPRAGLHPRIDRLHRAPLDRADLRRRPAAGQGVRPGSRPRRSGPNARDLHLRDRDREARIQRRR